MSARESTGMTVVAISGETMGRGDDELGRLLLRNYLLTVCEADSKPDVLVFLNTGVRLAASGSPVLEELEILADQGVRMLLCGTCINHFDLKDHIAVGEVSNMYVISETMLSAAKVVNL